MTRNSLVKCCSPLSRSTLSDAQAGELERVFTALADRPRVKILNRLIAAGEDGVCVCEFTDTLGLKQPTVSYHLKQLADAGLVTRERRGTFAYYRLVPGVLGSLGALLASSGPTAVAA